MAFDLATAKADLGIAGAAQDAALQRVMNVALNIVEKYLDRLLMFSRQTMAFRELSSNKVWVPRYPIVDVFTIDGAAPGDKWTIHKTNGWIKGPFGLDAEIDFSGGYQVLPPDLEWALWSVFNVLWQSANQQTGGIGQVATTAGEIESVTIPDVGTVRFSTGGAAQGQAGGAGNFAAFPAGVIDILQLYRRESC